MAIHREDQVPALVRRRRVPSLSEVDGGRTLRGLAVITGCIVFWLLVVELCRYFFL